jgi:hypothetical protein
VPKIFLCIVGLTADIQIGGFSNSKKESVLINLQMRSPCSVVFFDKFYRLYSYMMKEERLS